MTIITRTGWRRALSVIVALPSIGLLSSPAFAKKAKRGGNAEIAACVTNYKSGLDQEKTGRLLEARELFIRCSKSACGSPLREECTMRFTQLGMDIPSVVPVVTSGSGKPITDVEVQCDGQKLASSLDGHSFIMNPGPHDFSFSKDGHIFATQSLMIVQGQRNRLISASLAPLQTPRAEEQAAPPIASANDESKEKAPSPSPSAADLTSARATRETKETTARAGGVDLSARAEPTAPNRRFPTLSIVTAGVGVAALGAGALFTYWGRKDNTLLDVCSPGCRQSSADHIHNLYLAADISFGVGLAAIAGAYWAYAHVRSSHEEGESEVAVRSRPALLVAPTASGAMGALSGSF
jgi:hypothetical protein